LQTLQHCLMSTLGSLGFSEPISSSFKGKIYRDKEPPETLQFIWNDNGKTTGSLPTEGASEGQQRQRRSLIFKDGYGMPVRTPWDSVSGSTNALRARQSADDRATTHTESSLNGMDHGKNPLSIRNNGRTACGVRYHRRSAEMSERAGISVWEQAFHQPSATYRPASRQRSSSTSGRRTARSSSSVGHSGCSVDQDEMMRRFKRECVSVQNYSANCVRVNIPLRVSRKIEETRCHRLDCGHRYSRVQSLVP